MRSFVHPYSILLVVIFFGIIFRVYNINYDDLWIDEIITFWIANPDYTIIESFENHRTLEQMPFLFNLSSKMFHAIFSYNDSFFRYLTVFFSIASIFSMVFLSRLLNKNNSYIFVAFLLSFNIFLISYSQEMRVYSTLFFFNSISIYFFFKYIQDNRNFTLFFLFLTSVISILLHPFSFILIFSFLNYLLYLFFKKKVYKSLTLTLILVSIIFLIFYYFDAINSLGVPTWIELPKTSFFTNYYSSKFFGSRLVGAIHLVILIWLILIFFIKKNNKKYVNFFLIFLFYSYALPLIYSYLFDPIILPRYIIFVLIPIILLISHLSFELKNLHKKIIIFLVVLVTLGNFVTEETFKQIYKERNVYKPEFNKALKIINASETLYYNIKIKDNLLYGDAWLNAVDNYLNYLSNKNNYGLVNIKQKQEHNKSYWYICIHDLNEKNCSVNGEIIEHYSLNRLEILLLK